MTGARRRRAVAPPACGDGRSAAVLVEENRGLAVSVARRFYRYSDEHPDDYLAAADLGLVEAASSFDPELGRFSTWAYKRILRRVLEAVRTTEHPLVPSRTFDDRAVVRQAIADLGQADPQHDPSDEDVAMVTGLPLARVAAARRPPVTVSIDAAVGDAGRMQIADANGDDFVDRTAVMSAWPYLERWGLWVLPRRELQLREEIGGV